MKTTQNTYIEEKVDGLKIFALTIVCIFICAATAFAQTTEFTYQGKLNDANGQAAAYDFEFRLCIYETLSCSPPLATFSQANVVPSSGGIFTVKVDFGNNQFSGTDRYVEIAVRRTGTTQYTTLAPRREITSAPYAIYSSDAGNANSLGSRPANQYVLTTDPRLSATNYVQNGTTAQTGVNFNVGGTGTAGIFNAAQFNINNQRFLSGGGNSGNVFLGLSSGAAVTTGFSNTFVGKDSGFSNTSGSSNVFVGGSAGFSNTEGTGNSFFGLGTGMRNTTANSNSFFGSGAGQQTNTGGSNSFFGSRAGDFNTTGTFNTTVGADADVGANNLTYATAVGAGAVVSSNNTIVLGRTADNVQVPGTFNANTFNVATQYNLGGNRILSNAGIFNLFVGVGAGGSNQNTGSGNSFVGYSAGQGNLAGYSNSFFGNQAGSNNTSGSLNSFFGSSAGVNNTQGLRNTFLGEGSGFNNSSGNDNIFIGYGSGNTNAATQVNNSMAIGSGVRVSTSNTILLGTTSQNTIIPGEFKVIGGSNGTDNYPALMTVDSTNSNWGYGIAVGSLHIDKIPPVFLNTPLCFQAGVGVASHKSVGLCQSASGSSSLKTDAKPFTDGLAIVKRLQPMRFKWKENGSTGIGLNAEEVAAVDTQLVDRDEKGEIAKVNENSLNIVLVNAVKEQQAQIERQQKQIDALKKLVCSFNAEAEVCKEEK